MLTYFFSRGYIGGLKKNVNMEGGGARGVMLAHRLITETKQLVFRFRFNIYASANQQLRHTICAVQIDLIYNGYSGLLELCKLPSFCSRL